MNPFTAADYGHMAEALRLARRGEFSTHPNPMVGCVIVRDGEVVGRGFHQRAGGHHAEVFALQEAGARAIGATAYVTLEPCAHTGRTPPCARALVAAGVSRVVAACLDSNPQVAGRGLAMLAEAGIATSHGLLREQAEALNPGFLRVMAGGLPWLRVKVALSADGRTAMASGESKWITGAAARADVQRWRARSSLMLTGIGTVLADDPQLLLRPEQWLSPAELTPDGGAVRQPLRWVLDRQGRFPCSAQLAQHDGLTVWHGSGVSSATLAQWHASGIAARALPGQDDLRAVLTAAAAQGLHTVMLEAGATLTGAFLQAGLVDELLLYQAPTLLGSSARAAVQWDIQQMAQQCHLLVTDRRQIGQDTRTIYRVQN